VKRGEEKNIENIRRRRIIREEEGLQKEEH